MIPKKKNKGTLVGGAIMFSRPLGYKIFPIPEQLPNEDRWTELHIRFFSKIIHSPIISLFYRIHSKNSSSRLNNFKQKNIEMHERFSGNYRESKKEEDLQKKFWKKFLKWDKENVWPTEFKTRGHKLLHPNSKLSSEFLINNQKWLD